MCLDGNGVNWEVIIRGGGFFIRSLRILTLGFVEHAFCGRGAEMNVGPEDFLNSSTRTCDNEKFVVGNWSAIAEAFGLRREQFLKPVQVHGDGIIIWDSKMKDNHELEGDAIVTRCGGVALCVDTADCIPLLFVDSVERVIAVVHAGWRGTALNISGKVVDVMRNHFGTDPANVIVTMGPSIGLCCYEIDGYVHEKLLPWLKEEYIVPSFRPGHWYVDLQGVNRVQLIAKGVLECNIDAIKICTFCNSDHFFSYRRDGARTGRQTSFILLKNT
ncbi:MAG: peptidoglycan editing factor PgeF [Syntrophales bacterium]|nr:peptidoglycan editing factor PgeF [Syntrophales bacterium]